MNQPCAPGGNFNLYVTTSTTTLTTATLANINVKNVRLSNNSHFYEQPVNVASNYPVNTPNSFSMINDNYYHDTLTSFDSANPLGGAFLSLDHSLLSPYMPESHNDCQENQIITNFSTMPINMCAMIPTRNCSSSIDQFRLFFAQPDVTTIQANTYSELALAEGSQSHMNMATNNPSVSSNLDYSPNNNLQFVPTATKTLNFVP
ncbi:hypothetical protein NADFUDRAFT_47010 [Nadsonia fulvescens var. elongata DSM 6958]|uniref:Uncharacterized protein n=1 Tax=Nadsonia fulvescens var. elongata DSM 6958 TaxID=857566 RepID=A0A1E3PIR9_9ASCO|nr:hypothetical protein NADFUDRAFT_47010 [Nadsonia fulvescens var. elongata DSM 6958]